MERLIPALAAVVCGAAAFVWIRAAIARHKVAAEIAAEHTAPDLWRLAQNDYRRDIQSAGFAAAATLALVAVTVVGVGMWTAFAVSLLALPATMALIGRSDQAEVARIAASRAEVEKRAREVLSQEDLAPLQWAARLAPSDLPEFPGFEIGQEYQASAGAMSGDFYDVFRVDTHRVAAVIGDVTGHGIEPSITALQAKYLLRAFLLQYRDPGQALEELNAQLSVLERGEEFISLAVLLFDTDAETVRYASAGHPAAFMWHQREVLPLVATGSLLMLEENSPYHSRELAWELDDVIVLYTDGLAEARNGDVMFGEDGVAAMIRRDPTASPDVLTKVLVEAARDFAAGPITDDVAVLVLRRV